MSRRSLFQLLLATAVIVTILLCIGGVSAQGNRDAAFERVKEVQEGHTASLMAKPGVVGTGIALNERGEYAVAVLLERPGVGNIPDALDGVSVRPIVTGKIYALPKPDKPPGQDKPDKPGKPGGGTNPKKRFERPVPIGVSTGNAGECSSGTIACRVSGGGGVYALSNNHVYALQNEAPIGSDILQPGRYDAKPPCAVKSGDVIGSLANFVEIEFSETANNVVDAAIAATTEDELGKSTPSNGYGTPRSEPVPPLVGQAVQKYGRTTGLTTGTVEAVNVIVVVDYGTETARFVDQIMIGPGTFSSAGDSGSLVVTDPGREPVGLLFAGSLFHTFANPIGEVLSRLDVSIDGEE